VVGAGASELLAELGDLQVEFVDQVQRRVDRLAPGARQREPLEKFAAGDPEQV
jgi:hypothetical protein